MKNIFCKKYTDIELLKHSKKVSKQKTKAVVALFGALSIATGAPAITLITNQTSAATCPGGVCNTTFEVDVSESLSVSVEAPTDPAEGEVDEFLRNTVTLDVTSNNPTGFTATMYADGTSLVNESESTVTIPSLANSSVKSSFPANYWGYSLDTVGDTTGSYTYNSKIYNETNNGNSDSYYHPLPASSSPDTVLTGTGATTATRNLYFGAKADASQESGTYTGTIVISVVTGEVKNNNDSSSTPSTPVNPAQNSDTTAGNATYSSTYNRTVYYTTTSNTGTGGAVDTTTTEAEVSTGDTTRTYANAAGVMESTTSSNIAEGNTLATGLAITSAVAATSGVIFFILAKRKKDDEEEEDEEA